jgi:DNA-binding protein HU-beta
MTKADVVKAVAQATGLERTTVAAAVESIVETIKGSIIQGEPVYLRGFGTFGIKHRAAKPARNISKNTTVLIPETDVPYFKPAKEFKANVKK